MPSEKFEKGSMLVLKRFNKMEADIPQNNSTAVLVNSANVNIDSEYNRPNVRTVREVTYKEWISVFVLCFVNLINYMDRFTVAGVLKDIQDEFKINDDLGGLLQTAFILTYMIFGPLFGYLGDRYKRTRIMACGVFLWSLTTLSGSFMSNYWWFLVFRGLVGIGEASYSTIAPTIISDLFVGNLRSQMLAIFYFAIPVGSGLGYIIGAETSKLFGGWQWGLRVTPALGFIAVILLLFFKEPIRGQSEHSTQLETTSWWEDVKELCKNRSFLLSSAGFTCVAFVAGALSWWGPKFIDMGIKLQPGHSDKDESVAFQFGIITMASGLLGVPMGSLISQRLRPRHPNSDALVCGFGLLLSFPMIFIALLCASYNLSLCLFFVFLGMFFTNLTWAIVADIVMKQKMVCFSTAFVFGAITMAAGLVGLTLGCFLSHKLKTRFPKIDPLICAGGLMLSSPLLLAATYASTYHTALTYILLFLGQVSLNLNWAIVSDILLYVVLPNRRSGAQGFQLLVSHALGDAGSPYLIGVLSDTFQRSLNYNDDDWNKFKGLQYALFATCFVEILGGFFFLATSLFLLQDKSKVEKTLQDNSQQLLPEGIENEQNVPY